MSRLADASPSTSRSRASPAARTARFGRSELSMMDRRELLRWVNRTVGVDYVQVENCADGVAFAQLLDAAYPDARVPLYRLDFATRHEHDRARNLEIIRATLDRLHLDLPLDVKGVSRGESRACDDALRLLYLVIHRELPGGALEGYDGMAKRLEAREKRRYLARAPSRSPGWKSAASREPTAENTFDDHARQGFLRASAIAGGSNESSFASAARQDVHAPHRPLFSMWDGGISDDIDASPPDRVDRGFGPENVEAVSSAPPGSSAAGSSGGRELARRDAVATFATPPATAPLPRRTRRRVSPPSIVTPRSARVDIQPERDDDPRDEPDEPEPEPEIQNPNPSTRRLTRSLDRWAERARAKLFTKLREARAFALLEGTSPKSPSASSLVTTAPKSAPAFSCSRRRAGSGSPALSGETAILARTLPSRFRVARVESHASTRCDDDSSCDSSCDSSGGDPSEVDLRGDRARRRLDPRLATRSLRVLNFATLSLLEVEETRRKEAKRAARIAARRAEVAAIRDREAERRRLKARDRRKRAEADVSPTRRAERRSRLAETFGDRTATAAREEFRGRKIAREVRSAFDGIGVDRAREEEAPSAASHRFVLQGEASGCVAPGSDGSGNVPQDAVFRGERDADLRSLAEYLKWELASELKQFALEKRLTASALRERDDAVVRLGVAETRRRLSASEPRRA